MKRRELAKHGINFIEGQINMYCSKTQIHQRSYICIVVKASVYERLKQLFPKFGVQYIAQSNAAWDLRGMKDKVWVTKKRGVGTVCIELLEECIAIDDDDVYVVMWNKRFLPQFFKRARFFDMDVVLLSMLSGKTKPPSWIVRVMGSILI